MLDVPFAPIEISGLIVNRGGQQVLPGLDLSVQPGVTGLLGPSGCGKTTLLRSIVGVQRIAGGEIRVLDQPAGAPQLRHQVAYATQAASVYADLSVRENLRFFARVLGVGKSSVSRVIEAVALGDYAEQVVSQLSGGQRSRVSLAVALLSDPKVLVLDEPTVGLDPVLRRDLWTLFHHLAEAGAAVLVSSHVMDEAERCDQLVLMREGQILAHAPPWQVKSERAAATIEDAFLSLVETR